MSNERQPYAGIKRVPGRSNCIDTHELLKNEIYAQGYNPDPPFRGLDADQLIQSTTNIQTSYNGAAMAATQPVGFEDTEIYFDSTRRNNSDYTNGEVSWDIVAVNGLTDINNCVEMHLGEFYFPKIYAPTGHPEFFYFRRVFIEFKGAPTLQAVLGSNGNKFHFEMEVQNITGQAVRLVPIKKSFFFQRPVNTITNFRLKFMVPPTVSTPSSFKKINIPPDTVTIHPEPIGVPGVPYRFRINAPYDTTILGPIGSTGVPGIAIFITGYVSITVPSYIPAMNSPDGIYVTNIIDLQDFEVNNIEPADPDSFDCQMYVPKNRFAFPVRFTSVRNQSTNYVDIGHD